MHAQRSRHAPFLWYIGPWQEMKIDGSAERLGGWMWERSDYGLMFWGSASQPSWLTSDKWEATWSAGERRRKWWKFWSPLLGKCQATDKNVAGLIFDETTWETDPQRRSIKRLDKYLIITSQVCHFQSELIEHLLFTDYQSGGGVLACLFCLP